MGVGFEGGKGQDLECKVGKNAYHGGKRGREMQKQKKDVGKGEPMGVRSVSHCAIATT